MTKNDEYPLTLPRLVLTYLSLNTCTNLPKICTNEWYIVCEIDKSIHARNMIHQPGCICTISVPVCPLSLPTALLEFEPKVCQSHFEVGQHP